MANLIGNIEMTRGDSYPLSLRLKDKATKKYIDITGYTFLLTVDPSAAPEDDTTKIFQVAGVVDLDQENNKGTVTFTPTDVDTGTPGDYFYDIQYIDGDSHKKTFVKGFEFTIPQDITK